MRTLLRELRFAPTDAPDERWFIGERPRRRVMPTLHRWPTTAGRPKNRVR
jgi:hypothetical protein